MKSKSGLLYENSKKTLRVAGWFKAKTQWSKKPETFFLLFGFSLDPIQRQIETARKQAEKSIKEQKKFAWLWAVAVLLLGLFAVLRLRHVILTTFHRLIKESEDRTKAETTLNMELKEAEVARKIQISCLPKSIPKNPQYEIAAKNIPSKVVGGDIYDIFEKEDRLIVFLGDASGYSFSASLLTVSAKLGLYQEPCFENLKQIGWNINQSVRRTTGGDDSFFVTFVYSYIKEHRVHFLACGHHLFLHFKNSDQSITWFPATGFWGGFYETKEEFNHEVEENSFEVAKNDLIMIITDGITEAEKNGEEFGKKSVEKFLSVSHDLPVQKIVDGLLERVKNYADDDLTAICIRIREEK